MGRLFFLYFVKGFEIVAVYFLGNNYTRFQCAHRKCDVLHAKYFETKSGAQMCAEKAKKAIRRMIIFLICKILQYLIIFEALVCALFTL